MSKLSRSAALIVVLLVIWFLSPESGDFVDYQTQAAQPAPIIQPDRLRGQVQRVADGDSFTLIDSVGRQVEVRMHGIDAPERNQPHANVARSTLQRLLEGQAVEIEVLDEDNYGRQVGVVYRAGENINLTMVEAGHAWWYEYYASDNQALAEAQRAAVQRRLGLWAEPNPVAPWDWRRSTR